MVRCTKDLFVAVIVKEALAWLKIVVVIKQLSNAQGEHPVRFAVAREAELIKNSSSGGEEVVNNVTKLTHGQLRLLKQHGVINNLGDNGVLRLPAGVAIAVVAKADKAVNWVRGGHH